MARNNKPIYKKWWFYLIIISATLVFFTPLGQTISEGLFPKSCKTWETNNYLGMANDCSKSGYVCVPRDKEEFCSKNICDLGGAQKDLARGHTLDNPGIGICRPPAGFPSYK